MRIAGDAYADDGGNPIRYERGWEFAMISQQRADPLIAAIVVAAGRGLRAGGPVPKQYRPVAGVPVLRRTLGLFAAHPRIAATLAVIGDGDERLYAEAVGALDRVMPPARGGATRQASCLAGLRALAPLQPDIVLIHDAARPFASRRLIDRAIDAAGRHGAAVPGLAVTDTIKTIDEAGLVVATPPRANLRAVQTPQAFRFADILDAHERAAAAAVTDLTDDGAVAEWAGQALHVFEGETSNMKLTTEADFDRGEALASPLAALGDVRTGNGFDVHAACPGDHVWLNGVRIPHDHGLAGHSDADVGLHALTDAVLGAIGEGDIGTHFPPSDPQWRGARSEIFLRHAVGLVEARGGRIAHLDVTLLCEAPKIGPHREVMRATIAAIAGIDLGRVGLQATTMERLGFVGRGEGIAAMATATVRLPWGAS